MSYYLVVLKNFLAYVKGDVIADSEKVADILSSDYRSFVSKVRAPELPKG